MSTLNTLFVGKVLHKIEELESTNEYAQFLLSKNNPPEGTVITTPNQTAGRGQIGSSWESAPYQNLTLSIIFYPQFIAPNQQFLLNQVFSLAVRDFIAQHLPQRVWIKWPNDIYIENEKVSGILIQSSLTGKKIAHSIVGIGINVNQKAFVTHPPNATSLALQTGQKYELLQLHFELFQHIEWRYMQLKRGQHNSLYDEYLEHLYRYQKPSVFAYPNGKKFEGTIVGIDPTGKLKIATSQGVEVFGLKEVRFI